MLGTLTNPERENGLRTEREKKNEDPRECHLGCEKRWRKKE